MSEEKSEHQGDRLRLQWVVAEDSPEAKRAFGLEEQKLAQARQIHEEWVRVQDHSHQAWIEKNDKAIAIWERIAVALEALVRRP